MRPCGGFRHGAGIGPLAGFGRANVTWSFNIPSSEGGAVDVDRLLWSPGDLFSDYGDGGDDDGAILSRSRDFGRFGADVASTLSGPEADILVSLCLPPASETN